MSETDKAMALAFEIDGLDESQAVAVRLMGDGGNVFLTGNAGTGKSYTLCKFIDREILVGNGCGLNVCASTGVAALNLRDQIRARTGRELMVSTFHRFFGIGLGPNAGESVDEFVDRMTVNPPPHRNAAFRRIRTANTVIIDEISMITGGLLAAVDALCRVVRSTDEPFGGIRIIACGDPLQLPPVTKTGRYDWFFRGAWDSYGFRPAVLRTPHRQADPVWLDILDSVRYGRVTERHTDILRARVKMFPPRDLVRLFTHNVQVDKHNKMMLAAIQAEEKQRVMTSGGDDRGVQLLRSSLLCPETLKLKVGARVMVTMNITDPASKELMAVNGSTGVVKWMSDGLESVDVTLDDGREVIIAPYLFTVDHYNHAAGWVKQVPLRLCYAMSIHKSQGITLDAAIMDLRACREPGQTYTALSRVRSLEGVWLREVFTGVFVSREAIGFMEKISDCR